MDYYLDSNVYIHLNSGTHQSLIEKLLNTDQSKIKIPSIVAAELLTGVEKSVKKEYNKERLQRFLNLFDIVSFDEAVALKYAEIRASLEKKSMMIGPNDLIIAATVSAYQGILVTNNTREFSRVPGLILEDWTIVC